MRHLSADTAPSRRTFLAAAGLTMAAAAVPSGLPAQTSMRIDVHHHFAPPAYRDALASRLPAPLLPWTAERSIAEMDASGVRAAVLSITAPGLFFGDAAATRALARACNDDGARIVRDHPGRFGLFAALPMPDVDATLAEIAYAFDTLKADGVTLYTSYGNRWLGDASFAPVFAELDRRRAVVFTHPITNACCASLAGLPPAAIEYGADTTRTIANYVFTGAAAQHPNVRMIFSSAGGTMPFLIERFDVMMRDPKVAANVPAGIRATLARFSYDVSQAANPEAMGALTTLVPVSQVLFGTDYPFRGIAEHVANLRSCGFDDAQRRAIEHDNPARLFTRFA